MKAGIAVRLAFIVLLFMVPSSAALGATPHASTCPSDPTEWLELRSNTFAVIYTAASGAQLISSSLLPTLDQEYKKLAAQFDSSLPLPINIRIYETEQDYYCLNPGVPEQRAGFLHAHIGDREISFINEDATIMLQDWNNQALNAIRYEIASLFVENITDRNAPTGLVAGVSGYAEDPAFLIASRPAYSANETKPTWSQLWNDPQIHLDAEREFLAATTVAYLSDVYGWPKFVAFLKTLSTSGNYYQALADSYGFELADLEDQWQQYLPYYVEGRWRAHPFYNFDLSAFEELMKSGAYADAADELKQAITFLEGINNQEKLAEAKKLQEKAQIGQDAAALTRQARQSLVDGQYEQAIQLGEEAKQLYTQLGDSRRLDEIESYQSWASEVIDLRKEMDEIQTQVTNDPSYVPGNRPKTIAERLSVLGDDSDLEKANQIYRILNERSQEQTSKAVTTGLIPIVLLLLLRVLLLRLKPRPEAIL